MYENVIEYFSRFLESDQGWHSVLDSVLGGVLISVLFLFLKYFKAVIKYGKVNIDSVFRMFVRHEYKRIFLNYHYYKYCSDCSRFFVVIFLIILSLMMSLSFNGYLMDLLEAFVVLYLGDKDKIHGVFSAGRIDFVSDLFFAVSFSCVIIHSIRSMIYDWVFKRHHKWVVKRHRKKSYKY